MRLIILTLLACIYAPALSLADDDNNKQGKKDKKDNCGQQANAQGLKGKARKDFMKVCTQDKQKKEKLSVGKDGDQDGGKRKMPVQGQPAPTPSQPAPPPPVATQPAPQPPAPSQPAPTTTSQPPTPSQPAPPPPVATQPAPQPPAASQPAPTTTSQPPAPSQPGPTMPTQAPTASKPKPKLQTGGRTDAPKQDRN